MIHSINFFSLVEQWKLEDAMYIQCLCISLSSTDQSISLSSSTFTRMDNPNILSWITTADSRQKQLVQHHKFCLICCVFIRQKILISEDSPQFCFHCSGYGCLERLILEHRDDFPSINHWHNLLGSKHCSRVAAAWNTQEKQIVGRIKYHSNSEGQHQSLAIPISMDNVHILIKYNRIPKFRKTSNELYTVKIVLTSLIYSKDKLRNRGFFGVGPRTCY